MERCRLQASKCRELKWLLALKHIMYKAETMHLSEATNLHFCSPSTAGCSGDKQRSSRLYFQLQHSTVTSFLFPVHPLWSLALSPAIQGNRLSNHMDAMALTSSCSQFPVNPLCYTFFQSLTANFSSSLGVKSANISPTANFHLPLLLKYLGHWSQS